MSALDVSVIVPVRNQADLLMGQLEALSGQHFDGTHEIVVVDNGSTDGTAAAARRWVDRLPGLRVVEATGGRGVNHARNVGARSARGRLLAYVDADDEVADGWLAAVAEAGAQGDVVGGALDQGTLNPSCTFCWEPEHVRDGLPTSLGFLPFAVGANVAVRAEVLAALGGWDERYRWGGNDVDLSWRAQLAGYRLVYAPGAVVRYRHRTGARAIMRRAYAHDRANVQLYRAYRAQGACGRGTAEVVRSWAWLVVHLPDPARGVARRGRWCRELGAAAGRLTGSVARRTWYL